jgi:hypothetical protein
MPHIIRLRGPWQYQPLARFVPLPGDALQPTINKLPPGGVIALPADWGGVLGSDFQGTVRFLRRFNRPTGLDAASRVWLVIEEVDFQALVALNGREYGEVIAGSANSVSETRECPTRFEITADLAPHNLLSITVTCPGLGPDGLPVPRPGREGLAGGLIGLVRLEIE